MRGHGKFTTYLLDLLAPLGAVSARPMFGGVGLFQNGMMFGLIARDELFFKVGEANRPAYEEAGEGPFAYDTKNGTHTLGSYWRCPPDALDDAEVLRTWAREAMDAALTAARKKPPAKSK